MPIPEPHEAAPYYFKYIGQVHGGDIVAVLHGQLDETLALLSGISEERSLHRYAPDKWSLRQVINHVNDCERLFLFRAFWFARGFDNPLPSFDEKISAAAARADDFSWASHVEDFRASRLSTLAFFRNLPAEAWMRSGTASGMPFTVNALAYLAAGHLTHHLTIIRERYL
ncbi:MAG: hypothetical protein QOH06_4455 [Acidobacteriota bacterium]|jgi:uncharacterized damage-inducible protein DinB|nr:hypothetical protein [Acidobacteriota bacterium]